MDREHLKIGAVIVVVLGLTGGCIMDYVKSEPALLSAVVQDKQHIPGHYETRCSSDDKGRVSCRNVWVPPVWTILYSDEEGGHSAGVGQAMYQSLRAGQAVHVHFYRGAYTGIRYGTNFSYDKPRVEKW